MIDLGRELVSCLMVTQASRWASGEPAGASAYRVQTYEPRELVMVTADPCAAMLEWASKLESVKLVEAPFGSKLGKLRQLALEAAGGEFVATWDDDDISAPRRLEEQLLALDAIPSSDGCLLLRVAISDQINQRIFTGPRHTWEMTLVARRESMPAYNPDLQYGEDSDVIAQLGRIIVLDQPELFAHVAHTGSIAAKTWVDEWWAMRTGGAL